MSTNPGQQPNAVLVSHRRFFEGAGGGAQICSQEYLETISAAGVQTELELMDFDTSIAARLVSRFSYDKYRSVAPSQQIQAVKDAVRSVQPQFVFLNQVNLAPIAQTLREVLPASCQIILLSHGLESTDLLHQIRLRGAMPLSGRIRPTAPHALGQTIIKEAELRVHIDGALVLSPSDAVLESWMGRHKVAWIPRVLTDRRIDWRPVGDRLGFVGTLDHAPNLEGLVLAAEALDAAHYNTPPIVRVIGGPASTGQWLQEKYACIDYLGPLSDEELLEEARSWNAFIHPIFCGARGCSTKLASAIGWALPIVTTEFGQRGYAWGEGSLAVANTPTGFAEQCVRMMDVDEAAVAKSAVVQILESGPKVADVACMIADFLYKGDGVKGES
ncbi:MAG: glycosyltransferase [Pseudomonadota bacterium]